MSHDPSLLFTREGLLQFAGFEVESTMSTEQALKSIENAQFDLIVIGHTVPVSERLDLIAHCHTPSIPVLFVSSLAKAEVELLADATTGPMPAELLRKVTEALTPTRGQDR